MGHLMRMVGLGTSLKELSTEPVRFFVEPDEIAIDVLERSGHDYETVVFDDSGQIDCLFAYLADQGKITGLVLDVHESTLSHLESLSAKFKTVFLDKFPSEASDSIMSVIPAIRLPGDTVVSGDLAMSWGAQYIIIRDEVRKSRKAAEPSADISVALGGQGLPTQHLLKFLAILSRGVRVKLILGPYTVEDEVKKMLAGSKLGHVEVIQGTDNYFDELLDAKLTLTPFGVTAYELLCAGQPMMVYRTVSDRDILVVEELTYLGSCINGLPTQNLEELAVRVDALLEESGSKGLKVFSARGQTLIDGRGVERVVEEIFNHFR